MTTSPATPAAGPVTALASVADRPAPLTLHGKSFAPGTFTPVVERERVALRLLRFAGPPEWRHLVLRPAPAGEPFALALLRYGSPLTLPGGRLELRPGLPTYVIAAEAEMLFPWTRP